MPGKSPTDEEILGMIVPPHPAKYSKPVLDAIKNSLIHHLRPGGRILDPFAGVGGIHHLRGMGYYTVGIEIEPEWAEVHPATICGDSRHVITTLGKFQAVVTSPTYGNRMADHHEAKDDSVRNTYRHKLGRRLSHGSSAGLQWGREYKELHAAVWDQVPDILVGEKLFVLNISDHIRKGEVIPVTDWHVNYLASLGFFMIQYDRPATRRQKMGANGHLRVPYESVITFRLAA